MAPDSIDKNTHTLPNTEEADLPQLDQLGYFCYCVAFMLNHQSPTLTVRKLAENMGHFRFG